MQYDKNQSMKKVVQYLREGWYGNGDAYVVGHPLRKRPVSCKKLWVTCLKMAGTNFVSICDGIEGQIGTLVIDDTFRYESVMLPLDTLVVDLKKDVEEDIELLQSKNI